MPPEKSAYALARYSRSADSIRQSIDWVRTHDSAKFLESFYFQYGHASIAGGSYEQPFASGQAWGFQRAGGAQVRLSAFGGGARFLRRRERSIEEGGGA